MPAPKTTSLTPAQIIVEVPADAQLYIDGQLMTKTSERRVFNTVPLEEGQTYFYDLRAQVVRDGNKREETKRVIFRAGVVIQASFRDLDRAANERAISLLGVE
jgi:uncharacterized protein (TIGR03000 family)